MLAAAPIFSGSRLARSIRVLLIISGTLSLSGLSGVFLDESNLRSIGIVGYAAVFPVVALLLAILFYRTGPREISDEPGLVTRRLSHGFSDKGCPERLGLSGQKVIIKLVTTRA